MEHQYTEQELKQLHAALYEILGEVIRVCEKCHIGYFITGGTAIGAHFWQRILPWDDDIDIGMTRENYDRFLAVAPQELGEDYFLQWMGSDARVPFFFAKVRKHHTLFREGMFRHLPIHHGIFVDIFPFDHLPRRRWAERLQYEAVGFLNACFIAKELWQWPHLRPKGVPLAAELRPRSFVACLATRIVNALCPKPALHRWIVRVQTWWNRRPADYYKQTSTVSERVRCADADHPCKMPLGPLMVSAPAHIEDYLHAHYPVLRKDIPKEQQVNHRPAELSFDTRHQPPIDSNVP